MRLDRVAKQSSAWRPTDLLLPSFNGTLSGSRDPYWVLHQLVDELGLAPLRLHDLRGFYTACPTGTLNEQRAYNHNLMMWALRYSDPRLGAQQLR